MGRRAVKYLVVHCSATPETMDIGRDEIDGWHKQQGWASIGYHVVIRRDGTEETGRPLDEDHLLETDQGEVGAHVAGHNAVSVGICLVGGVDDLKRPKPNFTPEQYTTLEAVLRRLTTQFPDATVRGHRDFPKVAKSCPSFDAQAWWANRA